jgi:hypothetical protein
LSYSINTNKTKKKEKEKEVEKKIENQRKQLGEMVDDQTTNQTAKSLKKEKKNHTSSGAIEVPSYLTWCYNFSIQSCLSLPFRQVWISPVVDDRQEGAW